MERILCIADEKRAYFYKMDINNFNEVIELINIKYRRVVNDIVKCLFIGNKPVGFGKYTSEFIENKPKIIAEKIVSTKYLENIPSRNDFQSFKNTELNEWDYMYFENRQMSQCLLGGQQVGAVELTLEYPSSIAQMFKDAFESQDYSQRIHLVDLTSIIKLYNKINNIPNDFAYDRTLNVRKKSNVEEVFSSIKEYKESKKIEKSKLNEAVVLSDKEANFSNTDLDKIITEIINNSEFSYFGSIQLSKKTENELEILKRFAIRNRNALGIKKIYCLVNKLLNSIEDIKITNYTLNNLVDVCDYYDLDGKKEDRKTIKEIKFELEQLEASEEIQKLFKKRKKN